MKSNVEITRINIEKAYSKVSLYSYSDDINSIYISNLFVKESKRKNNLGNNMLCYALILAKLLNVKTVYIRVNKTSWMYEWYRRNGFIDSISQYRKGKSNMIWMEKTL